MFLFKQAVSENRRNYAPDSTTWRAVICAGVLFLASPATRAESPIRFDIAAQPLPAALKAFASQANMQLLYRYEIVDRAMANALVGAFQKRAALDILLQGTGLKVVYSADNAATILQAEKPTPSGNKSIKTIDIEQLRDTLRLTQAEIIAEGSVADRERKKATSTDEGVEEMIVQEGRIKPFKDANLDIPRTRNDVQPYYIFDSETIERSAALNVEDFLKQRLTMNTTAQTFSQYTNGTTLSGNFSSFNLRGLGADKTIVLINGRRIAGPGGSGDASVNLNAQADLNGIPMSAIDRIEVLPSSASGIYGGGALGGVINVILKRNYTGGDIRATYDNTWDSDAPNRAAAATYGFDLKGTQMMFTAQWAGSESLLLQDRRELFDRGLANILRNNPSFVYSNGTPFLGALPNITSTSDWVNNATVPDPGTLTLKSGAALGSRFTFIPAGTSINTSSSTLATGLAANSGSWNLDLPMTAQNPTGLLRQFSVAPRTKAFMLSLRREFLPGLDVSVNLARNENNSLVIGEGASSQIFVPAAAPSNPFTSAVLITHPNTFVQQVAGTKSSTDSASLSISSKLPRGWIGQADYTWSRSHSFVNYSGFDGSSFDAAIVSGVFNPFVDTLSNPLEFDDRYYWWAFYDFYSIAHDVSLRGSGPLVELPFGTPNLTVGAEHRIAITPENSSGLDFPLQPLSGNRWTSFKREQSMDTVYAELLVPLVTPGQRPLLHSLEIQGAGRAERTMVDSGTVRITRSHNGTISYAGTTLNGQPYFGKATYTSTNNTLGFKYQPTSAMTFRVSKATAFLPPTPAQLLKNPLLNANPTTVTDPLNNNASVQVRTISGGNPDLMPQNSRSFNAGMIWEPGYKWLRNLRFNAEYYKIRQFDAISSLSAQLLIANEQAYPGRVIRNSAGAITMVDTSLLNLYQRDTEGWDLSVDYRLKTRLGTFNLNAAESMILNLRNQYSLTLPSTDAVNFPSEGGAAKYKSNIQLTWDYRNLAASWTTRYFSRYKQNGSLGGPSATSRRATNPNAALAETYTLAQGGDTIPAQIYHDLYIGYAFGKSGRDANSTFVSGALSGVTLQFGVKNVFNTPPPFDVYYSYYISPYGDTRLRSYWLSAKKAF